MFGDSDDGLVVKFAQGGDFCRYRSLLASGAILFGRDDFKLKAGALDDKTRWLVGEQADSLFEAQNAAPTGLPVRQAFPEGGYYILGRDFETESEIRLIVDAGPLGYGTIAAHGHADALSFTLSVGGIGFLIDPGTYAYHTQGRWRQYFRCTAAHNTVRVDGLDQSVSGGNFMWLKKACADCRRWSTCRRALLEFDSSRPGARTPGGAFTPAKRIQKPQGMRPGWATIVRCGSTESSAKDEACGVPVPCHCDFRRSRRRFGSRAMPLHRSAG